MEEGRAVRVWVCRIGAGEDRSDAIFLSQVVTAWFALGRSCTSLLFLWPTSVCGTSWMDESTIEDVIQWGKIGETQDNGY